MPVQYHLLNTVKVNAPRWHDRVILPKLDKFRPGYNRMTINHHNYPSTYVIHHKQLEQYPTEVVHSKQWGDYQVKVIPLADLKTLQEHADSIARGNQEIRDTIESFGWWTVKEVTKE